MQRALLALLVLNANRVLARERIIHELWNDSPPATVNAVLSTYVSRLRRLFAVDREVVLLTETAGYMLRLPPERVDARRFEELVEQGRRALAANDVANAAQADREALALWRGEPLADLADKQFAGAEVARLEELHTTALEDRIEADLALGRHAGAVAEVEALVAEHPYRERLRGQLMLTLYRSGRQAEALAVYRDTRRVLAGELGIEPSRALGELEAKILRHDASLEPTPPHAEAETARVAKTPSVARSPRHRLRQGTAATAGLLALAAAAVYALAIRPTGTVERVTLVGDSVAVVDPTSGVVAGEVPVGGRPGGLAVGPGAVWVGNRDDKTLLRIDPKTRRVMRRIGLAVTPDFVTLAGGSVWVAGEYERRVVRVDPDIGSTAATITLPGRPDGCCIFGLETARNAVWASVGVFPSASRLWRIDATTNDLAGGPRVAGFVAGPHSAWLVRDQSITRIDPASGDVVDAIQPPHGVGRVADCQYFAAGDGALWAANREDRTVWRLDAADGRLSRIVPLGRRPIGLAVGAGAVWVASADRHLLRIDARSGSVRSIPLGVYAAYHAVAVGEGAVWLSVTRI